MTTARVRSGLYQDSGPGFHYEYVVDNDPLNRFHAFSDGLSFGDGLVAQSVEGIFGYLICIHENRVDLAHRVLTDQSMRWRPASIRSTLESVRLKVNPEFLAHSIEIYRAIVIDQLNRKDSPLRRYFYNFVRSHPEKTAITVCGKDHIYSSGLTYSEAAPNREMKGQHLYGLMLEDIARCIREDDSDRPLTAPGLSLQALLNDTNYFREKSSGNVQFPKSILIISDSHCRYIQRIYGGDCASISGARFADIMKKIKGYSQEQVDQYRWIIVHNGINDYQDYNRKGHAYDVRDDFSFYELRAWLIEQAKKRPPDSVLLSCPFDHPGVAGTAAHSVVMSDQMRDTGVACLNWEEYGNPFLDTEGNVIKSLFQHEQWKRGPRVVGETWFHLNHPGLRKMWQAWATVLNGIQFIEHSFSEKGNQLKRWDLPERTDNPLADCPEDDLPAFIPMAPFQVRASRQSVNIRQKTGGLPLSRPAQERKAERSSSSIQHVHFNNDSLSDSRPSSRPANTRAPARGPHPMSTTERKGDSKPTPRLASQGRERETGSHRSGNVRRDHGQVRRRVYEYEDDDPGPSGSKRRSYSRRRD